MQIISGGIDPKMLKVFSDIPKYFGMNHRAKQGRPGFGNDIIRHLIVTHASVKKKAEEPLKQEGRVVCELIVTEGMSHLPPTGRLSNSYI
jgi:hypothetical protein